MIHDQRTQTETKPEFYTAAEAATMLRLDESTLYRHLRAGTFPGVKIGGKYAVPAPSSTASSRTSWRPADARPARLDHAVAPRPDRRPRAHRGQGHRVPRRCGVSGRRGDLLRDRRGVDLCAGAGAADLLRNGGGAAVRDDAAGFGPAGCALVVPDDGRTRPPGAGRHGLARCGVNAREWRAQAACRSVEPERFFPAAEAGPVRRRPGGGREGRLRGLPGPGGVPRRSPGHIPEGIAGGLTPAERGRLRRPVVRMPTNGAENRCREREAAGRVLLAAGRPVREVARHCGVSERTAARWAARLRAITTSTAEGSSGGHRAPS